MTQMTPPGWHPDPGHSGIGPAQERWWDGSRWTDQLRVPPATVRRRRMRVGAAVAAGVVLLAAVGGGAFLLGQDSDGRPGSAAAGPAPSDRPSGAPGKSGTPGTPEDGKEDGEENGGQAPEQKAPPTEEGYATDLASGISIPVPDGWTGSSGVVGAGLTTGEHPCPGDAEQKCVRGGVFSAPAAALELKAATAEEAAKEDIAANAEESYGEKIYEGITSHRTLKSEAVTVAGQKGYLVRWEVVTKKGDDGYVESLVFPSPTAKNQLVVVRSGFDINDKAPKLSVLDDITKGIKAASNTGAGEGSGESA